MTVATKPEKRAFQAEVQQVLNLMINSLYSHKEIFLRELISNASDACDKLRFAALADQKLYGSDSELAIQVTFDEKKKTVSVFDNGIGMTRDEVIENIGTIANSGTKKFLDKLTGDQQKDSQLIGQFGVGFYSAFIIADKVEMLTTKAGEKKGTKWVSEGTGEYTIEPIEREQRGTEVILHLKKNEKEFLDNFRLKSLISKYSDHIAFPIKMQKVDDETDDKKKDKKEKTVEWEAVNQASALWTRPKKEISDEEYQAFYKHVSHDFEDALTWSHNRVEGKQSYSTLFYIPKKAPFDLMMGREERRGLKLYVKRVFIMDAAEQLLPTYLRFVKGVVDSDDLPLNVSREILQDNPLVTKIRSALVKRVLDLLEKLSTKDAEKYQQFWQQFGQVIKEGPAEDFANKEKIAKLIRFASTKNDNDEQTVSLADYILRMQAKQEKIYYITADSYAAAKNSPHLEVFRKKDIEVLLLFDRVDEWMMGYLNEYDGKQFQSVAKGSIDIDASEKDKKQAEEVEKEAKDLVERVKKALDEQVKEVKVSQRLTDSAACLVLDENEMAVHMQKLMQQAGHAMPESKPTLEINVTHPLVKRLEQEQDDDKFNQWSKLLYEQALLSEGGQLEDPASFVNRLNTMFLDIAGK